MKNRFSIKGILAGLAAYSIFQLMPASYINLPKKADIYGETARVSESFELEASYTFLKEEAKAFIDRQKNRDGIEKWGNLEKIYSGAAVNEEIGLGVILYKYKIRKYENLGYLVVVNTDRLRYSEGDDRFQIIGDVVISGSIDDLASRLEECYNSPGSYRGTNLGYNLDFDKLKAHGVLYIGVPYTEKRARYDSLIYVLNFKKHDGSLYVTGSSNGALILEGTLDS